MLVSRENGGLCIVLNCDDEGKDLFVVGGRRRRGGRRRENSENPEEKQSHLKGKKK